MGTLTFWIAVLGAIISTGLGVIRLIEFLHNRALVVVKIAITYPVYGDTVSNKAQLSLTAINKGRDKTHLEAAGLKLSDNTYIPFLSDIFGNRFPKELDGNDSFSVFFDISGISEHLKKQPGVTITRGWFREKTGGYQYCSIPTKIKQTLH